MKDARRLCFRNVPARIAVPRTTACGPALNLGVDHAARLPFGITMWGPQTTDVVPHVRNQPVLRHATQTLSRQLNPICSKVPHSNQRRPLTRPLPKDCLPIKALCGHICHVPSKALDGPTLFPGPLGSGSTMQQCEPKAFMAPMCYQRLSGSCISTTPLPTPS